MTIHSRLYRWYIQDMKQFILISVLCLLIISYISPVHAELTLPGALLFNPQNGLILAELEGSLEVACIRFMDGTVHVQFTISADPIETQGTAEVTVLPPGALLFNEAGYGIGRVCSPLPLADSNQLIIHGTRKLVACLDGNLSITSLNPGTIPELVLNTLLESKQPLGARQLVPLDFDLWAREGEYSAWRAVTDGSDDSTRLVLVTRQKTPLLLLHRFPFNLPGNSEIWKQDPQLTLRRLTGETAADDTTELWLRSLGKPE